MDNRRSAWQDWVSHGNVFKLAVNPGARTIVLVCLSFATLMQSLDSTIANVALPYMQGSLSASYDQITWVLTSYVSTLAICVAPVGWLAARFGRRNLLILCTFGFTATSVLCGIAGSLTGMVIFRAMQGAFGAALVPLSQATIFDIYPQDKRAMAMSIWGTGAMVGPILGPTLGGYLTAAYDWRSVFFINLPVGLLATAGLLAMMPREKNLPEMSFDWTGFAVLSIALGALQIGLDRGEELDWLSSPFIITCFVLCGLGFYLFIVQTLTVEQPFIPRAMFADRTYNAALLAGFSIGMTFLASTALLSPYLETMSNDPVSEAGLLMSPRGIGVIIGMLGAGRLVGRVDARVLLTFGNAIMLYSLWSMMGWTPDVSAWTIGETMLVQGLALGAALAPLQLIAFDTLPATLRTQAASIFYLVRTLGSAIGVSITSATLERSAQAEHSVLAGYITPFARPLQAGAALVNPGRPAGAALLNAIISTQAQIIAYVDDYKLLMLISIPAALSVLLMQKARPVLLEPAE